MKFSTQTRSNQFVLSLLAVLAAAFAAQADIATGLKAYLRLDETTGLTAADATGNGHAATLLNFAGDDSQWVRGRTNGACQFKAANVNYSTLADAANALDFSSMPSPALTLAAWVRGDWGATQLPGTGLLCKGYGRGGEQFFLDLYQNNFRFFVRGSDTTGYVIQQGAATTINAGDTNLYAISGYWQLVVGVYDGTQATTNRLQLYVNGQLVARQTNGPTALFATAHEVSVGAREDTASSGYNLPFAGRMDEVRIYGRALSAADVLELYQTAGPLAPDVLIQPVGANVFAGDPVGFSVLSDGTTPLTYQWKRDGTNITGATTSTYSIVSAQLKDAGSYTVAITNTGGFVISAGAMLTVSDPPANLGGGLMAHLKLDETAGLTASDATGNGPAASLVGFPGDDTQWVAARDARGLAFTNGEYATIDDSAGGLNSAANPTPAFTVAAWVKGVPGVQVNDAAVIAKGYGNGGEQFAIDVHNGVYRFFLRDGNGAGGYDLNSTATVDGSWQHLVAVYNNVNAQKFYINGQLVASRAAGPATLLDTLHEVSLAARESGQFTGYDRPYAGTLDDVRLYNRALTPKEVQMLYTNAGVFGPEIVAQPVNTTNFVLATSSLSVVASGTFPLFYQWRQNGTNLPNATNATLTFAASLLTNSGNYTVVITNLSGGSVTSAPAYLAIVDLAPGDYTTALVAEWNFDETSGTTAADSSGRGNVLNLFNFPGDDSQWVTTSRIGGRALRFNAVADDANGGTNDYCVTATGLAMPYNYDLYTFAFWVKLDSTTYGSNPRVITPSIRPWVLWSSAGGMRVYNGTPGVLNPQLNKWTHYVLTYDRANRKYSAYTNGVKQVSDLTVEAKTAPTAATLWKVGHNEGVNDADFFRGQLDDVRVYNRLLRDSQVAALYAAAPPFIQISVQPQSVTATERDPVTLVAAGDSSQPISYQWFKGATPVAGATNASLNVPFVRTNDAGSYSLVISNSLGKLTTSPAVLGINPLPIADIASGLLVRYTFDETSGDAAHDSSGNGYDATLFNWDAAVPKWEPGVMDNALRFNAGGFTNNYVQTPSTIAYNNVTDFTFSFWAKVGPEAIANNPRFFATADYQSWVLWQRSSAPTGVGFWHGGGAPAPETNAWHQYVVVFSRATGRYSAYMDGVRRLIGGIPTNPAILDDPTFYPWIIGHRENVSTPQDQESFRGWLDDMRIYNRLFSLNDVEALYQASGVAAPGLRITRDGNTLTLSWPSWASDFAPESTDTLATGATWTAVPGTVILDGLVRSVSEGVGTGVKYYRLHKKTQ